MDENPLVNSTAGDASDEEMAPQPSPAAQQGPTKVSAELKQKAWALRSVLKVFTTSVEPNYSQPWQMYPQRSSTGSAFVLSVEKKQILTNSHVISCATAVYVRRPGNAKKFKAEVVCEGKVCDLALLTVHDDKFWQGEIKALTFSEVPELQSPISVAGYPVGGDSLSITKGIVSRLTLVRYSNAARLLGIQIDAAINPGNSGGPAFSDLENGLVAGVAFSKNVSSSTDNIGYVIPYLVVKHFLTEYEMHGTYRGVPSLGFVTQDLENPAQKKFLKVPEDRSGVCVVKVTPLSDACSVIHVNDVITHIDGHTIADDATCEFREDERLDFTHIVRTKHAGDVLPVTLLRAGVEMQVAYTVKPVDLLVPVLHGVDAVPSYFAVGGLVFTPLSSPFLEVMFGGRRSRRADIPVPVMVALNRDKEYRHQQAVILVQVLAHEINHGYKYGCVPCEAFNRVTIRNLRHLAWLVDNCTDDYLNFHLEGGKLITLERKECLLHSPGILTTNALPADRSEDLKRAPLPGELDAHTQTEEVQTDIQIDVHPTGTHTENH
eukprot:GDKI01020425.1.p1 GENE.GDKI01020425.1~~GDKI01020425.1.p1  ORF type:complete len:548 (+),score=159.47 GDKI01020425.1:159-1802(+)